MRDFTAELETRVAAARAGTAYANYRRVRDLVVRMMDDWIRLDPDGGPSAYWRDEIEGFLYLFDASPLLIERLREQCYHITGVRSYEYRAHHAARSQEYADKYAALRAIDQNGLWVPEADALGGFGFDVGAGKANMDTLKFYEVLIGMDKAGVFSKFRGDQPDRRVALEIGSGWGGFAYQFKTLFPNTTYVCVDLPPTMLFSGVYLTTTFPQARVLFYGEEGFEEKLRAIKQYDFVFMPHFFFQDWKPKSLDLGINMVSFQEMTGAQVEQYIKRLRELDCPRFYSLNRERSPYNSELGAVSEVIGKYYQYKPIEVLDMQYTQLRPSKKPSRELGPHDYRHYAAWRA